MFEIYIYTEDSFKKICKETTQKYVVVKSNRYNQNGPLILVLKWMLDRDKECEVKITRGTLYVKGDEEAFFSWIRNYWTNVIESNVEEYQEHIDKKIKEYGSNAYKIEGLY